jgi:hypothetical protein
MEGIAALLERIILPKLPHEVLKKVVQEAIFNETKINIPSSSIKIQKQKIFIDGHPIERSEILQKKERIHAYLLTKGFEDKSIN